MAISVPTVKSANGFEMPIVGFGTWQATDEELEKALESALEAGYRHIDTAYVYFNEAVIGRVLHKWITEGRVKREDLYIVTKLPNIGNRAKHVEKFMDMSLKNLQLTYVDLYLIHTPFGLNYVSDTDIVPVNPDGTVNMDTSTDLLAIWKKMEELVDSGKTKAIGVSNFNKRQIELILKEARIRPVTNQIQINVYYQRPALVSFLKENGIIPTSYSTLGTAGTVNLLKCFGVEKTLPSILSNPVVEEISSEVNRTPAQVLLRHLIQKDIVVIPKSVNPTRIKQNLELFDFELSEEQVIRLDALDENAAIFLFPDLMKNIDSHPEYPFHDAA